MFVNNHHKKGNELLDEQKYDKALIQFNKALEKNPNHPDILSHRGVLYLHLNQKKNCLDDLLKALDLEQENSYRYASLAYARDFFGDLDGAIYDYQKAVQLNPDDAIAHNNLGMLLEKKGYQQKAEKAFNKADKLSKIEKKFYDAVDKHENNITPQPQNGEKLQPKKLKTTKSTTRLHLFKRVFTHKGTFKEFINFRKNGFKLNNNDKERKG